MADRKLTRLKEMLRKVAREPGRLESLAPNEDEVEEFVTESTAARGRTAANTAASALNKLAKDREDEMSKEEVFYAEAIILPKERPVVFIRKGVYEKIGPPWEKLNSAANSKRINPLIGAIGRIELPNSALPYGGTGFVVGADLMMTNRHVARLFADGVGSRIRYQAGNAAMDFKREIGMPEPDPATLLKVVAVEMIHPYWDMALLRVEGLDGKVKPLVLSVEDPEEIADRNVVVIGYPARDDRNDLDVQDRVFQRTYNVKRLQPGLIRERANIQSFENRVRALTHDSSTLGGNSGSAVIHVATGQVVALHFAGVYLKSNYAVPTYELARDARVVRLRLNFAGTVAATNEWDAAWQSATGDETGPAAVQGASAATAIGVPILRIDVSQYGVARGTAVLAGSGSLTEGMRAPIVAGNLANRTGYQDVFLGKGATVPLPALTAKGKQAVVKLKGGSPNIKYHKFSVVMHQTRRLALFTASNVDWRASERLIKGKKPTRKQLTGLKDGDIELWVTDDRLDAEDQLPDAFFTKDGGAFDKGHLVRRDDVVWGPSFKDMQKANGDTYHTTNCSPQVASFNQSSRGENNWGDLESLVQQQTKAERAVIFSGPVLDEADRVFVGKDGTGGAIRLKIPEKFWKIVVVKDKKEVGAFGFVLEQSLKDVSLEFVVPEEWQPFTASIGDIEAMLDGLLDLTWLKKRDRHNSSEGVAIRKALK
jgi:endonuclease G, mitochondrial